MLRLILSLSFWIVGVTLLRKHQYNLITLEYECF